MAKVGLSKVRKRRQADPKGQKGIPLSSKKYMNGKDPKPEVPRKPFVDTYELPATYNTTSVTLIARDPYCIHAYWEIAPSAVEELKRKIGSEFDRSCYVLRMYDVTLKDFDGHNANTWFDIDVGPSTNNWYINLWHDHVTYCADVGMRSPDGRFFAMARSNFVTTPRTGSSGRLDMMWMEVTESRSQRPFVIAETKRDRGAASAQTSRQERPPHKAGPSGRRIFLTEDDIRAYYSRLFPLLGQVVSARRAKGSGARRTGRKIYIRDGDILIEDFLMRGLSKEEFLKRILLGSSQELVLKGGASDVAKGGASEREQKKREFFFDIGTELIVYGRTEPGAEVWLGDKKIRLRDDGTFTLRFALPEGKVPLDFVARPADKTDEIEIQTAVERTKTKRKP